MLLPGGQRRGYLIDILCRRRHIARLAQHIICLCIAGQAELYWDRMLVLFPNFQRILNGEVLRVLQRKFIIAGNSRCNLILPVHLKRVKHIYRGILHPANIIVQGNQAIIGFGKFQKCTG